MLLVNSVFLSIDGEANFFKQGGWTIFIRMQGCSVGCSWCDTKYTWSFNRPNMSMTPEEVLDEVEKLIARYGKIKKVTITGGEPLEQDGDDLIKLVQLISRRGMRITIETSGVVNNKILLHDLARSRAHFVIDVKGPSANAKGFIEDPQVAAEYIVGGYLDGASRDTMKGMVADEIDFKYVVSVFSNIDSINFMQGLGRPSFFASPVMKQSATQNSPLVTPTLLFNWLKNTPEAQDLNIGLNLQLHKFIFPGNFREEES